MFSELFEDDFEGQIQVEVNQYIFYLIDEVSFDFEVMGLVWDNLDMNNILFVVLCIENVDMCVVVFDLGGLIVKVIDVEVFVLENVFVMLVDQFNVGWDVLVVVVDIGVIMIIFLVLCNQCIIYLCEQVFGGKQFIDEIMCWYGLFYEEVGCVKCKGGLLELYEIEVLELFKELLIQQISCLLQFFFVGSEYSKVDQVVLVGGCVFIEGLVLMLEEQFGIFCVVVNLLVCMLFFLCVQVQVFVQDVLVLMIVVGFVFRSFD